MPSVTILVGKLYTGKKPYYREKSTDGIHPAL